MSNRASMAFAMPSSPQDNASSEGTGATNRLVPLDSIRGLAALSVVICHYVIILGYTPIGRFIWRWLWIPPFSLLASAYGSVILFFVLSGYVLALSLLRRDGGDWGIFAIRRFFRIWPPFAAAIIVSFVIGHVVSTKPTMPPAALFVASQVSHTHLAGMFEQLAMLTSNVGLDPVGWSLVHEMRISLALPLLLVFIRRAPGATFAVSVVLNMACRNGPVWLAEWLPDTAGYIVYFVAGAWLALNRAPFAGSWWSSRPWNGLLCVFGLVLLSAPVTSSWAGLSAGVGATVIIAVVSTSPEIAKLLSARWCEILGRISYSLYLTHLVVLVTVIELLTGSLPVTMAMLMAVPVIGIVAAAWYRYIELPSIELGRVMSGRARNVSGRIRDSQSVAVIRT